VAVHFGEVVYEVYADEPLPAPARGLVLVMRQKQIEDGRICDHGHGLGTVTWRMIRRRAREIAVINGRDEQTSDSDFAQARRELLGEERLDPLPTMGEYLSEAQRWNPFPGTAGHKVSPLSALDEQTLAEKLVEEGMAEAEHSRQLAASRIR